MRNFKSKIKDGELPGLLFILDQILQFGFKSSHYESLSDKELQGYLDDYSHLEKRKKGISIEPFKKMFALTKNDTGYRPFYSSINVILSIYLEKITDFKDFISENQEFIENYYDGLDYIISEVNPEIKSRRHISTSQLVQLGNNGEGIQINLSQGVVANLIDSLEVRFGDILLDKYINDPRIIKKVESRRIRDRISLTEKRHQRNSENIIKKAIEFGKSFENSSNVLDPDWVSEFFNISQECSHENLQWLWAKILAGEIDRPGSFSRRTLHTIKLLDAKEAGHFTLFCNCLWEVYMEYGTSNKMMFQNSDQKGKFSDATWGFDSDILMHLEDIGLIHNTYIILERGQNMKLKYFDHEHELASNDNAIEIEVMKLSNIGDQISDIVHKQENIAYYNHTLEFLTGEKVLRK